MRRIVLILLPILVAAVVWAIAAGNDDSAPDTTQVAAATVAPSVAADADAQSAIPLATPRPPRKTKLEPEPQIAISDAAIAEAAISEEAISEPAPQAVAEPVANDLAKPTYTPRPPRKSAPAGEVAMAAENAPAVESDSATAGYGTVETPAPSSASNVKYVSQGLSASNMVALTFDDGPNAEYTPKLLAYLRENNVPATFFLLGEHIEKNPSILIEMAEYGFEIGNHSYNHADLSKASEQSIRLQLDNTSTLIEQNTGIRPRVMRPPYGARGNTMKAICDEMGLEVILWSIDTNDWRPNRTADQIVAEVEKNLKGGSIILMHDRLECTHQAVPRIVELVNQRGLKLVTVSELVRELRSGIPKAESAPAIAAGN